MYNNIALWTSVAIVEVSHDAAFTNCKETTQESHVQYTVPSVQAEGVNAPRLAIQNLSGTK